MTEEAIGGKGKRGPSGPLVATSDEDSDQGPDSPRGSAVSPPCASPPTVSPSLVDHDYDNVGSPGNSSTASGPTYVRPPGFTHHAHEVTVSRSKVKKKKTMLIDMKDGLGRQRDPTPPKCKPKRDPLPMRMRALPQSFWQQPNVPHNVSPASNYPVLPPLFLREDDSSDEVRPITPPEDKERDKTSLKAPKLSERKITVGNTDLLFKLFEAVEGKEKKSPSMVAATTLAATPPHGSIQRIKRGRPRKMVLCSNKTLVSGEDPYLVDCFTEKLFPQLNLEQNRSNGSMIGTTLHLVTLREGDRSVTLPSLSIDQNYSQMLSELVMHI